MLATSSAAGAVPSVMLSANADGHGNTADTPVEEEEEEEAEPTADTTQPIHL